MQPLKMVNLSYILELQEFIWGDIKKKKQLYTMKIFLKTLYLFMCMCIVYVCDYLAMQKM